MHFYGVIHYCLFLSYFQHTPLFNTGCVQNISCMHCSIMLSVSTCKFYSKSQFSYCSHPFMLYTNFCYLCRVFVVDFFTISQLSYTGNIEAQYWSFNLVSLCWKSWSRTARTTPSLPGIMSFPNPKFH